MDSEVEKQGLLLFCAVQCGIFFSALAHVDEMSMYFVKEQILALLRIFATTMKAAHPEPPAMRKQKFCRALVQLGDALCLLGRACEYMSLAHACSGNSTAQAQAAIAYAAMDLDTVAMDLNIATFHLTHLLGLAGEDQAGHRLGSLRQLNARIESIKCAASLSIKIVEGTTTSKEPLRRFCSGAKLVAAEVNESTAQAARSVATSTTSESHLACLQDEIDALEGIIAAELAESNRARIINDVKAYFAQCHVGPKTEIAELSTKYGGGKTREEICERYLTKLRENKILQKHNGMCQGQTHDLDDNVFDLQAESRDTLEDEIMELGEEISYLGGDRMLDPFWDWLGVPNLDSERLSMAASPTLYSDDDFLWPDASVQNASAEHSESEDCVDDFRRRELKREIHRLYVDVVSDSRKRVHG